jgi:hypothetical protein
MKLLNGRCESSSNLHHFVIDVLYRGCNGQVVTEQIVPLGTRRAKRLIQQGAEKLRNYATFMSSWNCCKGCTMGCGGVWFGRQLGLSTLWGKLMPQNPENEGTVFSENLTHLPTKLHDVILKKLAVLIFIAVRISGHMSFLHRNLCWLRLWSICLSPCVRSARGRCMMHRLRLHHAFSYISRNYAEIVKSRCGQCWICGITLELGTVQVS